MRSRLCIILMVAMFIPMYAFSQQQLEGIVYDVDTKRRLGEVEIRNLNTQKYIYNDVRGEFRADAAPGDVLVFKKRGYLSDTITFRDQSALIVNLKEQVHAIEEVNVYGRRHPDEVLAEMKREYGKSFELAAPGEMFSVGMTGAGLNINSLYNLVSKEGRNARRFTSFLEELHKQNIVDFRFTPELVRNLIGLEGEELAAFMQLFRPRYEFVEHASYYDMVDYIKSKYEVFKLHPNLRPLRELPEIELDVKKEN